MDSKKIGIFIAKCRKTKKLTQTELAEQLNVSDKTISRWENGINMPDYSIIKTLCEILDIDVNELLNGEKTKVDANKISLQNIKIIQKQQKKINQGIILMGCTFASIIVSIIFARENQMAIIFGGISIGYLIASMITLFKKIK